jgi:hypothetical protein
MQPNAFVNSALIQEETLLNVFLVLEQGWPAGPLFLHALNSLIEATVLHEHVYFDPQETFDRTNLAPGSVTSLIRGSSIVQLLLRESAIELLPKSTALDQYFEAIGTEYRSGNFLADASWTPHAFMYGSPEDEPNRLQIYLDLTTKGGKSLLEPRRLAPPI